MQSHRSSATIFVIRESSVIVLEHSYNLGLHVFIFLLPHHLPFIMKASGTNPKLAQILDHCFNTWEQRQAS